MIVTITTKRDNLYYINTTILKKAINTILVDTKPNYFSITTISKNSYILERTINNRIKISLGEIKAFFKEKYKILINYTKKSNRLIKRINLTLFNRGSLAYYYINKYRTKLSLRKEEAIVIGYNRLSRNSNLYKNTSPYKKTKLISLKKVNIDPISPNKEDKVLTRGETSRRITIDPNYKIEVLIKTNIDKKDE
ncbi:Pc21g08670 [Penicillium rubens Wisconsin 54-1255]|uniref:Pc21g08670 protein n=1 Tax=Penicillium rubens (strain ATCC 28089 / DSM 1075 / NRRL 1951 / Wisconsin 54-1255) TaxID=500485 RepID=B6HMC5_PENRW|nr:Pc21g08670 [Penicillium rubens Wisconsin 54-1255]